MLVNAAGLSPGAGFNAFLNWWKIGDPIVLISSINGTLTGQQVWDCPTDCGTPRTYLNASTGELVNPVPADVTSITRGFWTNVLWPQYQYEGTAFNAFANQVWHCSWTGAATVTLASYTTLGTGGSPGSSFGANSGTITFGNTGYANLGLTFTITNVNNPPQNIECHQAQYDTNVANGEILNPDWVATYTPNQPFAFIRLMDFMDTNYNGITDISQLADNSYNSLAQTLLMTTGFGSISGTTLTVGGTFRGTFRAGQRIVCIGCNNTRTIVSQTGGTPGGAGTYTLSGSSTIGSVFLMGVPPAGANTAYGPKGGVSPSIACEIANKTGAGIEYPIPIAATNQYVLDLATAMKACMPAGPAKIKFSYGNENWNNGFSSAQYTFANTGAVSWAGYRAAEMMEIIAGVYGTNSYNPRVGQTTSRWLGAIGAQYGNPTVMTGYIDGAQNWISSSPSPLTLSQLFGQGDVAPYWGKLFNGVAISSISAAANAVVTAANDDGGGSPYLKNGDNIVMFVANGTMSATLNNQYFTVSSASTTGFTINANTVGKTYSFTAGDGAMTSEIFKLADQSTTLNGSTPATYPTKFSYFSQQMSKAILTGSASDASYGTITIPAEQNLVGSALLFAQNALPAQANGLDVGQYEGGMGQTLVGAAQGTLRPPLAIEFLNQSQFDAGVTGDAVNTNANMYYTAFRQFEAVNGVWPGQFNDAQPQTQFGPWGALRFIPGDTTNPKWAAIKAQNALGRYSPTIPAPTWSVNYNSATDKNFDSGGGTSLVCPYTAPSTGLAVLVVTWADSNTITSASIDHGVGNMTLDASTFNGWSQSIFSKAVTGGVTYNITITWNTFSVFRSCYALTLTGLASGVKLSASSGNPQKATSMNITSGSFMIAAAGLTSAMTFNTASTQGIATGTVTQIDNQAAQASGFAYWSPGPSFSTSIFNVETAGANGIAAATYK